MDGLPGENVRFLPASTEHRCKQILERFPYWAAFRAWWILPVHLLFAATGAVIALLIRGNDFAVDGDSRSAWELSQVDIQTLVSAWLTVLRLLVSAWFSLLGWRIAFLTLERSSTTLSHVSRTVRFGIPDIPSFKSPRGKHGAGVHGKQSPWFLCLAWIALFLALPSQLASPLASGAFGWSPVYHPATPKSGQHETATVTTASAGAFYQYFNRYNEHRVWMRQKASALSALLAKPGDYAVHEYPSRAIWPTLHGVKPSSFVEKAILPAFQIHSLTWNNKTAVEGLDVLEHALIDSNRTLRLSGDEDPFKTTFVGAAAILLDDSWHAPVDDSQLPSPELISRTLWIAVLFNRNNTDNIYIPNCDAPSFVFGGVPEGVAPVTTYYRGMVDNCYAIGRVSFTAGAITCEPCEIVLENVIQQNITGESPPVVADSMTYNALHLMPEVMGDITVMNITTLDTWNNLDGFVRNTLSIAYQGSWNALHTRFSEGNTGSTRLWEARSMLRADVSVQKIVAWLMLQILMTLSGILLIILQRGSRARPVEDPVLTSILLDSRNVIDQDTAGLCTARAEYAQHRQTRVALQWCDNDPAAHHPILVVDHGEQT